MLKIARRLIATAATIAALAASAPLAAAADVSVMRGGELTAFTQALPKGGELHHHLSGSVFPETFIAWAVEDGLCVDAVRLALRPPCEPGGDLRPAAELLADDDLRAAMIDSLSTRKPGFAGRSGHDQFFGAFGRFGATPPQRAGEMLADLMNELALQHTFYLEVMVTPQGPQTRALGARAGWKDDFPAQAAAIEAEGLADVVSAAIAETDALEKAARDRLGCAGVAPKPGCAVTVRYLVQTSRILPLEQTFAQLQMGAALVRRDPRWVGLQMVAPESHPTSLANYGVHMRMVGFLTDQGRTVPVALHAGELSLPTAPLQSMRGHITEAVRVAGARRIGHGVALPYETDAEALAAEMASKGVLVEVNLTSNDVILGVAGEDHPVAWLRKRGVPTSLSTDDAGILRIDLSHEYARAAKEGASLSDLVRSARNALAFSFLAGEGLWRDPGVYRRPARACAGQLGRLEPRPGPCADLLASSDKAREQWRHERLLAEFERAVAGRR
jgi:hypothetical protein